MALKRKYNEVDEITINGQAIISKRKNVWQFRMWLPKENKYIRQSLKTTFVETAKEKAEELLFEIRGKIKEGKTVTSLTCKDGALKYIKYREQDVKLGTITKGRISTIKTHLEHWLDYIHRDNRIKNLDRSDCLDYFAYRTNKSSPPKLITLRNEQATINAMMNYLFEENEALFQAFRFRKTPEQVVDTNEIKRQTFTNDEWNALVKAMRTYTKNSNVIDADEMKERLTVRYWILIAANSGMRVGEQRQLKWSDVKLYEDKKKMYAQVSIRRETSKVRQSRVFNMRSGQHFKHLRETQHQLVNDGYVFSMCGAKSMHNKTVYKHFKVLMDLAEIKNWKKRRIVPYSLRHFCITQRRMAGVGYEEIADMCGTSVTQIRKVYWHLNDEVRHTTASKDYKRLNGKIIPL